MLAARWSCRPPPGLEDAYPGRCALRWRLSGVMAAPRDEREKEEIRALMAAVHAGEDIDKARFGSLVNFNGDAPLSACDARVPVFDALTVDQCRTIVHSAEEYAATVESGWNYAGAMHSYPPKQPSSLDVRAIPALGDWLLDAVTERILVPMAREFNLTCRLLIDEIFVAKYGDTCGQRGLASHQDSSEWSFVVALNVGEGTDWRSDAGDGDGDYAGGGTCFELLEGQPIMRLAMGYAIGFNGRNRHHGVPVTRGVRYILTGFLEEEYDDDDDDDDEQQQRQRRRRRGTREGCIDTNRRNGTAVLDEEREPGNGGRGGDGDGDGDNEDDDKNGDNRCSSLRRKDL